MFRTTLAISLALAAGAAFAATPATDHDNRRAQWRAEAQARFAAADADRDGRLDRVEAQAVNARLAERFDLLDANADGELTPEEMRSARHGGHRRGGFLAGLVKGMDDDGDGAISRAELGDKMPKWSEQFARIDSDADGRLSREELRGFAREMHDGRRGRGTGAPKS